MSKELFSAIQKKLSPNQITFTAHFDIRKEQRNIGKNEIENYLLNRANDLLLASTEDRPNGITRFRLTYAFTKKYALFIVGDYFELGASFKVVTCIKLDKHKQIGAVENAHSFSRLARRLR